MLVELKFYVRFLDKEPIMRVYCARPISGCSFDEVTTYYRETVDILKGMGYEVLFPMCGKGYLRNEIEFKAHGYNNPLSTNHAIVERDRWMTQSCDILFVYLVGAKLVSIGSVAEMAWAHHMGKHTIVIMEEGNIHQHAFILDMADVIFPTYQEGLDYLEKFAKGEI